MALVLRSPGDRRGTGGGAPAPGAASGAIAPRNPPFPSRNPPLLPPNPPVPPPPNAGAASADAPPWKEDREKYSNRHEQQSSKKPGGNSRRDPGRSGGGGGGGGGERGGASGAPPGGHGQARSRHKPSSGNDKKGPEPATKETNRLRRPSTFLGQVHFANGLPEPASQPKIIPLKSDPLRYTAYGVSSLEREFKYRMHTEVDMGIPLDLLDISPYLPPPASERPVLDPEDDALLRDDDIPGSSAIAPAGTPGFKTPGRRPKPSAEGLDWLLATQYIAPIGASPAKKRPERSKETQMLAQQLDLEDEEFLSTVEGQLQSIENTFRAAKLPPVHPTKPELEPVEILPLLPFPGRQEQSYLQVQFNAEPLDESAAHAKLRPQDRAALQGRALMKQFKAHPDSPAFLAYMVPKHADQARKELEEGEEVPYTWVREYEYKVQLGSGVERESFIFCFSADSVQYIKLGKKLQLQKLKPLKGADEDGPVAIPVPSKITVRKREPDEDDLPTSQRHRASDADEE